MEERNEVITVTCSEDLSKFECEMTTDIEASLRGIHAVISSFCDINNIEYPALLSALMEVGEEFEEATVCRKVESQVKS